VHISGQCRLAEKDGTSDTIFHQPTPKVRFQCVPFILQHMRFSYPHIRQLRFFAFPQRWKVSSSEKQTVSRYEFSHQCMTASQSQILPWDDDRWAWCTDESGSCMSVQEGAYGQCHEQLSQKAAIPDSPFLLTYAGSW
jgi:hypothetical protein